MFIVNFDEVIKTVQIRFAQKRASNFTQFGYEFVPPDQIPCQTFQAKHMHGSDIFAPTLYLKSNNNLMLFQTCISDANSKSYRKCNYIPGASSNRFCFAIDYSTEMSPIHHHDYIELIYVHSGQYVEIIENQELILTKSQICILNRNCEHRDVQGKSTGFTIFLDINIQNPNDFILQNLKSGELKHFFIQSLKDKKNSSYLTLSLCPSDIDILESYLAMMFYELESEKEGFHKMVQIYQLRILNIFARTLITQQVSLPNSSRSKLLFNILEEYIFDHLDSVNLDSLCQKFHYQKDYYCRIIKKNTGLTFTVYVKNLKINQAKHLLADTNLPIKEICIALGYNNTSYFYHSFKKETGITPQEYRSQYLSKSNRTP